MSNFRQDIFKGVSLRVPLLRAALVACSFEVDLYRLVASVEVSKAEFFGLGDGVISCFLVSSFLKFKIETPRGYSVPYRTYYHVSDSLPEIPWWVAAGVQRLANYASVYYSQAVRLNNSTDLESKEYEKMGFV